MRIAKMHRLGRVHWRIGTQSQFGKSGLGLEQGGADGDGGIGGLDGGGTPYARKLESCTVLADITNASKGANPQKHCGQ